jgi:WD40 repeat protein
MAQRNPTTSERQKFPIVRANWSSTLAITLVDFRLSVFDIADGGCRKLEDLPAGVQVSDVQFLRHPYDSFVLLANGTDGTISILDLHDADPTKITRINLGNDIFSSCLRVSAYSNNITFGFLSRYSLKETGEPKYSLNVYTLELPDYPNKLEVYPVRRYRLVDELSRRPIPVPSDEPIWFEFADASHLYWASPSALFIANLRRLDSGKLVKRLDRRTFGSFLDAAVSPVIPRLKLPRIALLGTSSDANVLILTTSKDPNKELHVDIKMEQAINGTSVQWSPFGCSILINVPDKEPIFISEVALGDWQRTERGRFPPASLGL